MFTEIFVEGKKIVRGVFDKRFENDDYIVCFNTKTGFEVLHGKNGTDPFKTELPLLVDVGIMGHCLNSCSFCYQGDKDEAHMSLENFKRIIDQVKHHTNQVALGGRGDPNLHPQFKEILEYARANDVVPNYTTSGRNLTDNQIEISKICGAVAVSDYGQDFTFSALKRLMDAGIKTNIHMIFTRQTFAKAVDIVNDTDVWSGNVDLTRLNAVIFLLFKPQGRGKDKIGMIPTKGQLESFAQVAFQSKAKFKVGMDSCLINHVSKYGEPNEIQKMAIDTCESSRMSVYISPSMHLIPCSFADHELSGIKILEQHGIQAIWNDSFQFTQFRNRLKNNPNCCPIGL